MYSNTAMRCKQPDSNEQITVQICDSYSTVLFLIQCDTVIDTCTAVCCKKITTHISYCNIYSALLASVLPVQYCKFYYFFYSVHVDAKNHNIHVTYLTKIDTLITINIQTLRKPSQ